MLMTVCSPDDWSAEHTMGLAWQQGPLSRNPNGQFLVPGMPQRVLYAEPLRRRMRAELDGRTVVQSDDAVLLFEPGRYPVAYFPIADFADGALRPTDRRTEHPELGETAWYEVIGGTRHAARGAWQHVALPDHAAILRGKVALAWHAMDAFHEEDDRILGHAADPYHRIDIRHTSRHSSSAPATASSPTPPAPSCSTSRGSPRAGMCPGTTSSPRH